MTEARPGDDAAPLEAVRAALTWTLAAGGLALLVVLVTLAWRARRRPGSLRKPEDPARRTTGDMLAWRARRRE